MHQPPIPRRRRGATPVARVLVAGVGNVFCRDDGFGPEVARRLAASDVLPPGVRAVDYGIRGLHLSPDLLDGCDALVLVATAPVGERRGDLVVVDLAVDVLRDGEAEPLRADPAAALATFRRLGDRLPPACLVGCRPGVIDHGVGLSAPVERAVPETMAMVGALVRHPCLRDTRGALRRVTTTSDE